MNANRIKSTIIIGLGMLNGFITTHYFGGHFFPSSPEECISDGINILILCLGIAVWK